MPIYEYRCEVCDAEFERRQSFDDPPIAKCPEGHTDVRRIFSPAGIIFKGPGFYVTDNRESSPSRNGNGTAKEATESKTNESKTNAESTTTDA